jgi:hypothetical protein
LALPTYTTGGGPGSVTGRPRSRLSSPPRTSSDFSRIIRGSRHLVELAPFIADERKTLASAAYDDPYDDWISFAEVPDEVWGTAIERACRQTEE